jgi:hypothetical protein
MVVSRSSLEWIEEIVGQAHLPAGVQAEHSTLQEI